MTDQPRDVVIFDLGGVLIDWDPRHLYRKLFGGDAARMERFLTEVCTLEWNLRQDAGRPWSVAVAELSAQHPADAALIAAYAERWVEMLRGPIDGTVAILAELKRAGRRLYALTNWSHETFPLAQARYDFLAWFDGIVVSGVENLVKPDRRLYERLLERHAIVAARAIFIDDSRRNVDAAVALGMYGIQFRSPDALRAELVALGLLG